MALNEDGFSITNMLPVDDAFRASFGDLHFDDRFFPYSRSHVISRLSDVGLRHDPDASGPAGLAEVGCVGAPDQ